MTTLHVWICRRFFFFNFFFHKKFALVLFFSLYVLRQDEKKCFTKPHIWLDSPLIHIICPFVVTVFAFFIRSIVVVYISLDCLWVCTFLCLNLYVWISCILSLSLFVSFSLSHLVLFWSDECVVTCKMDGYIDRKFQFHHYCATYMSVC